MYFKVKKSIIKKILFILLIDFLLYFSSSFLFSQNNKKLCKGLIDFSLNLVNYNNQLLKIILKEEKRYKLNFSVAVAVNNKIEIVILN